MLTEEDERDGDNDVPSRFSSVECDGNDNDDNELTAEEAERHQKIYKKLRIVSSIIS